MSLSFTDRSLAKIGKPFAARLEMDNAKSCVHRCSEQRRVKLNCEIFHLILLSSKSELDSLFKRRNDSWNEQILSEVHTKELNLYHRVTGNSLLIKKKSESPVSMSGFWEDPAYLAQKPNTVYVYIYIILYCCICCNRNKLGFFAEIQIFSGHCGDR